MEKLSKELEESSYKQTVSIAKDYYKHIIGKSGVNINKIRDETQTRIDLPEKNSSSADEDNNQESVITVTGKQANVEKAIQKLKQIQEHAAEIQRQTEERVCFFLQLNNLKFYKLFQNLTFVTVIFSFLWQKQYVL